MNRASSEWVEYLIREQVALVALLKRHDRPTTLAYRYLHTLRARLTATVDGCGV